MDNIRVGIVENDMIFLKEIINLINLQPDMCVVGVVFSKNEAVSLAKTVDVDLILMDINLNGNESDGILATMEIHQFSNVKIIMLGGNDHAATIMDSFAAGAVQYLLKENYIQIPNAIRLIQKNEAPYKILMNEFTRLKKEEQLRDLSVPEKEIYELIAQGYTQVEISKMLYKTQNTIKTQVKSILKKLNVSNSKEAVEKIELQRFYKVK